MYRYRKLYGEGEHNLPDICKLADLRLHYDLTPDSDKQKDKQGKLLKQIVKLEIKI